MTLTITPDPQGFADGPNLYAYLHNSPLDDFDLYGLWSWRQSLHDIERGYTSLRSAAWQSCKGLNYQLQSYAEWMRADFAHEYKRDPTEYISKSQRSYEGWKQVGKAVVNDPWGALIPGIMETYRRSRDPNSTRDQISEAVGRAVWDVASFTIPAAKCAQVAARASTLAKIGRLSGISKFSKKINPINGKYNSESLLQVGEFSYSKTAAKHATEFVKRGPNAGMLSRPYMKSPHTINEIIAAKKPIQDPGGLSGGLRWDVPGKFRGSEGTWELVLHPENRIIYHFNFSSR